jgi:hypothetical protein
MAFAFDVVSGVPRLTQTGTDANLSGMATAINAVATVARSTAYAAGVILRPPTPTGLWYRCATAGTTAATAPTYGTTEGGNTTDGTAIFNAFLAPIIRTIAGGNHYYMPSVRMQINGTLTNTNPQQNTFTCFDIEMNGGNWTSGAYASDGVTPLWNGVHFIAMRQGSAGAEESDGGLRLVNGAQFTFIGGEVQVAGSIVFNTNTIPRTYGTRWRNSREFGASSARIRSKTTLAIFSNIELFDIAYDLFVMPTFAPSIKARGSEYLYQYVGSQFGGADARFVAFDLENPNGQFDFDNFGSGWVELYNCKAGAALRVVTQHPSSTFWVRHCIPLYQELRFTARDTAGVVVPDVRFTATETPTNPPTVTFSTQSNLKVWDFRNPITYQTTTNASGIALSSPVLNVWYWQTTFRQSLRFPSSTAVYQGRAYNFKTLNVSALLGSSTITDVSAGMIGLDTATTVTESVASAITGITLTPSGATGGTITISSNKEYQDIWNYYRWWISQFANRSSNDTWTCTGGTLNTQNWNIVVNTGVTLTSSTEISTLRTLGTVTLNGTAKITGVYRDSTGTSTVLEINPPSDDYSLCVFKADGTTKYFASDVDAGSYYVYFAPNEAGTYFLAAEKYGQKRTEDTLVLNGGNVWYNITDQEDVGITDNFATASAYTTLSTTSEIYDATAVFRLSETGIKLGQLVARDGLYLDFGNYNVKIKDDASAIVSVASGTITYKSIVVNESLKYNAMKATPPKTITPTDVEIINVLIEDANGDSQLSILGGDNLGYELWKVTTATATDDYATGTLLTTLATNAAPYRFIGISGFDIVGRDVSSGVRRRSSMLKGTYTQAFYVGDQIQLATNAPQLIENNEKLSEVILKLDTNLDVAVSSRLADADYIDPATPQNVLDAKTEVLEAINEIPTTDISGLALETTSQEIKAKTDKMEFNAQNHIAANVHQLQAGAITSIQNGLSLEATSQEILTAVNDIDVDFTPVLDAVDLTLKATDYVAPDNATIAEIQTKVDTLENTDLTGIATATDVTNAQTAIEAKIDAIPATDLTGITDDLTIINEGVKKASLFIPHTQNL